MDEGWVVRREGFLDARAVAALLKTPGSFDPEPVLTLAREAFGPLEGLGVDTLTLSPGEGVAELAREGARGGFVLDLDPPQWRSAWGGLLLFQTGERLQGYRPVPGALTLFAAAARPLISLLTPGAPPRVSLLGWWV
ncbi:hypothetical protein QO010_001904 [Caulobacter ginsengisoli]|uniref:GNAT family N-acetyltransferase n=1 Tax=Caulobacter ginsengisoli TaxID=400775 RepID=A0ABU0IQ46_9CAUL|nr:hypothetical protein [Caulobacter ginsengisoli]MDQ0464133.1 hypothetical protein [Caulobacter ginsengisoli]